MTAICFMWPICDPFYIFLFAFHPETCRPSFTGRFCKYIVCHVDADAASPLQRTVLWDNWLNYCNFGLNSLCLSLCIFFSLVILNPCVKNPCLNGGTCSTGAIHHYDHTCKCAPLYTGRNCESKWLHLILMIL